MKTFCVAAVIVAFVLMVRWYNRLPIPYYSWSTQECVMVLDLMQRYSCEHPPTLHRPAVWVR